jgi:hypothetical protein
MNPDEPVWAEITTFLQQTLCLSAKRKLTRQTTLNYELGVDGDDADEVMAAFFERFQIEPGDYHWARYFGEEGFNPFSVLLAILRKKPKPVPLTLGMLEMAAKNRSWVTEQLEQAPSF